ncbi:hypothetical protein S40293_10170 [Stachybotrys chartarum IBT 40293]|nr:hypothetical protein S40293_10170 [Stachybotrys chartarum IBT 40293]
MITDERNRLAPESKFVSSASVK